MRAHFPSGSPIETYYKINELTSCWIWQGAKGSHGYPHYRKMGKQHRAHKWVYESVKGKVPDGLVLDHLCCNKLCVNPDHLEPKTQKKNAQRSRTNILTQEKADTIRKEYDGKWGSYKHLAAKFGVSLKTISNVVTNQTWT